MINIIKDITGFITYFAPGYTFIYCYYYSSVCHRETSLKLLVLKSITISYILFVFSTFVCTLFEIGNEIIIQAITFIIALAGGLVAGRVHRSKWANNASIFLFKREMKNDLFVEIWERAHNEDCVVYVTLRMKKGSEKYEGQLYKVLSHNKRLNILLSYYLKMDQKMKIISDCTNNDNAYLFVCLDDVQEFEYEYIPLINSKKDEIM